MPEVRGGPVLRAVWMAMAGLHLAFLLAWFATVARDGPSHGDWSTFRLAAERAFGGELDAVWATDFAAVREDRWFYPPFALWLYLPLTWMSEAAAYWTSVAVQVAAAVAAVALLVRELRPDGRTAGAAVVILVGSASFAYNLMGGQNGALFLLGYVLAAVAWRRGWAGAAGASLAVLGLKPNFTPPPALVFALTDRRALLGLVSAGVVLVAVGAPFGVEAWRDFWVAGQNQAAYATAELGGRHNLTVRGLLLALTGSPRVVNGAWLVLLVPALWATARIARSGDPVRRMSAVVLLTLSMNLYVNAYDGLVLFLPALDLVAGPTPTGPVVRRGVLVGVFVAWLWDLRTWLWPLVLPIEPGPFSLVGVVALGWLIAWAWEGGQGEDSARHAAVGRIRCP